jgi:probable rRNA maturation factor
LVVEISDTQNHVSVDPAAVRALVEAVLRGEGVEAATISVAVVDDRAIHRVNREFLGHDHPTDVVSFVLSDDDEPLAGELVVSAETAVRVAERIGATPWNELALYVAHGLLHLCGYDDLDEESAAVMRTREEAALSLSGLSNPYRLGRPTSA